MPEPQAPTSPPPVAQQPLAAVPAGAVPWNRYVVFALLALLLAALDLYSKSLVFQTLGFPGGMSDWEQRYFGTAVRFRLLTSFNEGALWGVGQGYTWVFAAFSVLAISGILVGLFVYRVASSLWLTIALGLITAGTLGNLYDRLGLHGYRDEDTGGIWFAVRDFLYFRFFDVYDYPLFNFADAFLVTGAIMIVLYSLFSDQVVAGAVTPSAAGNPATADQLPAPTDPAARTA